MSWAELINGIIINPLSVFNSVIIVSVLCLLAKYTGLSISKTGIHFNTKRRASDKTVLPVSNSIDDAIVTAKFCNVRHEAVMKELQFLSLRILKMEFYSLPDGPLKMEAGLMYLYKKGNHITAADVRAYIKEHMHDYDDVCASHPELRIYK